MDYLEPVLSGEMRESDEDEPVGDYVDMGPGVLTEWTQSRGTVEHGGCMRTQSRGTVEHGGFMSHFPCIQHRVI